MMLKVKTLVVMMVCGLLASQELSAQAKPAAPAAPAAASSTLAALGLQQSSNANAIVQRMEDLGCGMKGQTGTADACDELKKQFNASLNSSGGGCATAGPEFTKANDDMVKACGEAGITSDCATALSKCDGANAKHYKSTGDPNAPLDPEGAEDRYKICPAMANQDLKEFEDKLDKEDTKVKDLQDKIPDLQKARDEAQSNAEDKISDLQKQQSDNSTAHNKELMQMRHGQSDKEQQIMQQVAEKQAEIDKSNDQIRQIQVQAISGQVKFNDQKAQIRINCNNMAISQVSKMQTDVLAQMKANSFNRGGFKDLLKNVGLTDRAAWQRVAKKYYNWCMASAQTVESQNSANGAKAALNIQIAASQKSVQDHIATVQRDIGTLVNQVACGQATPQANGSGGGESALCRNVRESYEDMQASESAYQANQNNVNNQIYRQQNTGARLWGSANQTLSTAQNDLDSEKARRQNLYDYLQKKYQYSSGSADSLALSKALSAYVLAKGDANNEIKCVARTGDAVDQICDVPPCSAAKSFLQNAGESQSDVDETLRGASVDVAGKPTQPSTPTRVPAAADQPPPEPGTSVPTATQMGSEGLSEPKSQ